LKNNLPNLASAYETQRRVASTDGIFRSMYWTALLFRDASSTELYFSSQNRRSDNAKLIQYKSHHYTNSSLLQTIRYERNLHNRVQQYWAWYMFTTLQIGRRRVPTSCKVAYTPCRPHQNCR
jgi:hypothetical protein